MPDSQNIDAIRRELEKLPDEDLVRIKFRETCDPDRQMAAIEILEQRRADQTRQSIEQAETIEKALKRLEKPHCVIWWGFWVAVAAMIFAGIAALDVAVRWFQGP